MFVFNVATKSKEVKRDAALIKSVAVTAGAMFAFFTVLRITYVSPAGCGT